MSVVIEGSGNEQYLTNTVNTVLQQAGVAPVLVDGKDISSYFGVRATAKQKAMNTGRHPASMPKNSELWHYSKLSTQRRDRIKKGHQFWDVVEEESVEATIPAAEPDVKEKEDEYTIKSRELHFLKGSSINQKLRKFLSSTKNNDMQHLELRVDFKNKNQIYFGMSFIIMNYADEILYVNSREELRCKPISMIEPTDRIKFKMVDLNNPSNPQPLSFGDTMYLQCLDASETADNSFSVGTVLTSKLFGLPQHSSLNFDVNQNFTTTDNYTTGTSVPTDIGVFADNEIVSAPDSPTEIPPTTPAPHAAMRRGSTMNIVRPTSTASNLNAGLKPLEINEYDLNVVNVTSPTHSELPSPTHTVNTTTTATATVHAHTTPQRHFTNTATICGDCHITRICEMRQLENSLGFSADFGLLSDDKAMRYTSKAAALLGKWCVHSAELPNSPSKAKASAGGRKGGGANKEGMHSMHATKPDNHTAGGGVVKDHRVYSMSPIFIQQDLYCISTKQPSEHTTWPMRSTAIINHSKNIGKDTAMEYRTAYRESAVVKNALQARQHTKGTTRLYDLDETFDAEHSEHNNIPTDAALSTPTKGASNNTPTGGANNKTPNGANNKTEPSYGCLRKVVKRGPPYDFSVDRRCVWKFCLFEQFSDNNIKLSVKDRAAKKVMETATMAMKLSQLNREGAHTHIQNHTYGEDLPPLKSGESFVRTLREINFKTSMQLEEKYLQMRRAKEARLSEHFATHMTQIRQMERMDNSSRSGSRQGSRQRERQEYGQSVSTKGDNSSLGGSIDTFSVYSNGNSLTSPHGGSLYSPTTPKVPNLMGKNVARRTSFLIDTLPAGVKGSKSFDVGSANGSVNGTAGSHNGSVNSHNNSSSNVFSPSTASSRISAFGSPTAVRFDDGINGSVYGTGTSHAGGSVSSYKYTQHAPTGSHGASSKVGVSAHPAHNILSHTHTNHHATSNTNNTNNTNNTTTTTTTSSTFLTASHPAAINIPPIQTQLPPKRSNVTFSTPTAHPTTLPTPLSIYSTDSYAESPQHLFSAEYNEIQQAMRLVTQAVAGLPDFDSKAQKRDDELHLNPKRLILDNPRSLHLFGDLSEGEKVLALHKTFHHLGEVVSDPHRPRRHSHVKKTPNSSSAGVAAKLAKLMQEDVNIKQVLHHKERRERIKNKEELYEHSSGV